METVETAVDLDPLPPGLPDPIRRYAEALRTLASASGQQSLRGLAKRVYCSPATLSLYLRGDRLEEANAKTIVGLVRLARAHGVMHPDHGELGVLRRAAASAYAEYTGRLANKNDGPLSAASNLPTRRCIVAIGGTTVY
jgi:hypothetical protein